MFYFEALVIILCDVSLAYFYRHSDDDMLIAYDSRGAMFRAEMLCVFEQIWKPRMSGLCCKPET